ncbi:MAG TPA: orotate phosphoribosyltransferase [Candidatus Latescibacteria bacterium]|nr:orotate phosphoribosyltransferase [Candidatus Latescibacterota bacterium]
MRSEEVRAIFEEDGAILKGHFLLSSGLHSDVYFEKFRVLQHPEHLERLCRALAQRFRGEDVEIVVGPTTGGMLIAYEVAKALGTPFAFAEREEGKRVLRRGFWISPDQRVLVVDDVLTTGGSLREVTELVESQGGMVVGVGVLVDRSGGSVDLGHPLRSLLQVRARTFRPEECPLCRDEVPLVKPGSK